VLPLFLTVITIRHYGSHPIDLVYLIHDPSEIAKQKVADASQRMRRMNGQSEELRGRLNPVTELQPELEIKILENAPRNADKLRGILKVKQRQKEEETMYIGDIEGLGDEIEMLKVVLS
jgi:hypothetical protein